MTEFLTLMKAELVITVILFLLLFIRISGKMNNSTLLSGVQMLLLLNLVAGFFMNETGSLFAGMYHTSPLIVLQKNILSAGVYLISLVAGDWLKKTPHLPEFFMLMLSALLGMFLLISSGNLLIFYLALELSSIPVAAMANFDLLKKRSSEGAMKMILSSAFSSGILLFGISLIYGSTGSIRFSELPTVLDGSPLQVMAFVFFFTAFAFKLSIVPFHLWTADVYEGAPIATTSFLSVISKGAVAFIFLTVLYRVFGTLYDTWYWLLAVLAVVTLFTGNLFAIRQQNIKRLLAFSSIAQVGFILVAISGNYQDGSASVVYFLLIYIFSNLAAFGVASVISEQSGRENIDDYKGLYATNPFLCWIMALALFSLAGIPPTAGFFGKFFLLSAGAEKGNFWLIIIAGLNMVISLYYYLRIVRAMFMDKNEHPIEKIQVMAPVRLGLILCAAGILLTGLAGQWLNYIQSLI